MAANLILSMGAKFISPGQPQAIPASNVWTTAFTIAFPVSRGYTYITFINGTGDLAGLRLYATPYVQPAGQSNSTFVLARDSATNLLTATSTFPDIFGVTAFPVAANGIFGLRFLTDAFSQIRIDAESTAGTTLDVSLCVGFYL